MRSQSRLEKSGDRLEGKARMAGMLGTIDGFVLLGLDSIVDSSRRGSV